MADTVVEDADRDKIPNEAWENLQRKPDNPSFGNPTGARKAQSSVESEYAWTIQVSEYAKQDPVGGGVVWLSLESENDRQDPKEDKTLTIGWKDDSPSFQG